MRPELKLAGAALQALQLMTELVALHLELAAMARTRFTDEEMASMTARTEQIVERMRAVTVSAGVVSGHG
jgi:hypothetical protein